MEFLEKLIEEKTVGASDYEQILFTDDVDEALKHIQFYSREKRALLEGSQTPIWILGEKKIFKK
jgi:predicted Rossmann-fold nucleotide-binding protein